MQSDNRQRKIRSIAVIFSLSFLIVTLGFGCGMGFDSGSWIGELGNKNLSSNGIIPTLGDEPVIDVKANAKTVSIVNYESVLESMVTQTGQEPSNQTLDRFRARLGMYSETGAVSSVNSSTLLAMTTIAGELCNDLMATEYSTTPASNRRFMASINDNGGGRAATLFTPEATSDVVRRMARSFWQRNETPQELEMIRLGLTEIIAAEANINVRKTGLYICTSMLSSVAGVEI